MSKTIKAIDLLNKIANDESYRPTVKYQEMTYTYQWDIGDYTNDFNSEYGIFSGWALNLMLNNEVEIIEEQEEIDIQNIEELDENFTYIENHSSGLGIEKVLNKAEIELVNKINELVQAVKQLDKKIKEKG